MEQVAGSVKGWMSQRGCEILWRMISSPRKIRRGSWYPLVENRDEWGSLFRDDPIKIKNQAYGPAPQATHFFWQPLHSSSEIRFLGFTLFILLPPLRLYNHVEATDRFLTAELKPSLILASSLAPNETYSSLVQ